MAKDDIINKHLATIKKLSAGHQNELKSLKDEFENMQKELLQQIQQQKERIIMQQARFDREVEVKEQIEAQL